MCLFLDLGGNRFDRVIGCKDDEEGCLIGCFEVAVGLGWGGVYDLVIWGGFDDTYDLFIGVFDLVYGLEEFEGVNLSPFFWQLSKNLV